MKPTFTLLPACIVTSTNEDGEASVSLKIPGTFGDKLEEGIIENIFDGYSSPFPTGRYLDHCEIWSDTFHVGDRVTNFIIKDIDEVIPEQVRGLFPNYPIIGKFYDDEITETDEIKSGLFLNDKTPLKIGNIDKNPIFIPSGLYISGTFKSGNSSIGQIVRCNFFWGKKIS